MKRPLWIPLLLAIGAAGPLCADQFMTLRSRTYRVTTDVNPALARQIAEHMDAVNQEYHRVFADIPSRARQTNPLFVFASKSDYLNHLSKYGVNGTGSGGMFYDRGAGSGLATFLEGHSIERTFQTLQHEGFHQFARFKFGSSLPVWCNEGLADYFAEGILARGKLTTGHAPVVRIEKIAAAIRAGEFIPFEKLLNMSKSEWNRRLRGGEQGPQYDQSWSIVHFMYQSIPERRENFRQYLVEMSRTGDNKAAFEKYFGWKNIPQLEAGWKKYMLAIKPSPERLAQYRLGYIASGFRYLADKGKYPATLEELKTQLRASNYYTFLNVPGRKTIRFRASNEELFKAPAAKGAGQPSRIVELPPVSNGLPPTYVVEGLAFNIRLNWTLETDTFVPRITFE